jgi:hypothetical protein
VRVLDCMPCVTCSKMLWHSAGCCAWYTKETNSGTHSLSLSLSLSFRLVMGTAARRALLRSEPDIRQVAGDSYSPRIVRCWQTGCRSLVQALFDR